MFVEPHLGPGKIPRWWCSLINILAPFLLILFFFGLLAVQCLGPGP